MTIMTNSILEGNRFTLDANELPELLQQIEKPPKALFGIGNPDALFGTSISFVGARRATPYGLDCMTRFASLAASRGVCVVSGGAVGSDTAAHAAAVDAGGASVAVLAGGCDHYYPSGNAELFQRIIDGGGAVVSEHDFSVRPQRYMFVERNRIIAGLSEATFVNQMGVPSGTFTTVDNALSSGRDVLAVPGDITSPLSLGCNAIIAQGAIPVYDDASFLSYLDCCTPTLQPSLF